MFGTLRPPPACCSGFLALPPAAGVFPAGFAPALAPPPFLLSAIDHFSRTFGDANLAAIVEVLETDAGRLAVLRIGESEVGQMDRRFLRDYSRFLLRRLRP